MAPVSLTDRSLSYTQDGSLGDGHIGGIVTGLRAGGFTAIEGNTSRGNSGSQVNGWYVAHRFRTTGQLRGLIRLPVGPATP